MCTSTPVHETWEYPAAGARELEVAEYLEKRVMLDLGEG